MSTPEEQAACNPQPIADNAFNPEAILPYGQKVEHIRSAMVAFLDFLGFVNSQLHTKGIARLESMLMPANFSSIVGEFMSSTLPKYCPGIIKNKWLMVFVFDCNRPRDTTPRPFKFVMVVGAQLAKSDWVFSGRSETSRRTITASVTESGYQKMMANWIYRDSSF